MAGDKGFTDTLKCQRITVDKARRQGDYGEVDMRPYSKELERIFPEGVCKYSEDANIQVSRLIQKIKGKKKG